MNAQRGKLLVVVGGQYGSEGKGVVVAHVAKDYDLHVRVGGPNAGHSFMDENRLWKMQIVPCGWKNRKANCIIGRGGLVELRQLVREVNAILEVDKTITQRLEIDVKTGVLSDAHHQAEGGVQGDMHRNIGSTGEGVGAARIARITRDRNNFKLYGDICDEDRDGHISAQLGCNGWQLSDLATTETPRKLSIALSLGKNVLIEGTQGSGLSLVHGPWPFATSTGTDAAQMLADVGLSPFLVTDIMLVARSYPIRVFGNSGPMYKEITWEELSSRLGKEVREYTTVTKKLRRISEWDPVVFEDAVTQNQPSSVAVTFLDYVNPADEGKTSADQLSEESKAFLGQVAETAHAPVKWACTGWNHELNDWSVIDL